VFVYRLISQGVIMSHLSQDPSSPGAAAVSAEERIALLQKENAQMRTAGTTLQQQYNTLQQENQRLNAAAASAGAAASSPSSLALGSSAAASSGMAPLKIKAPTAKYLKICRRWLIELNHTTV
jgi:hypothetical protein